MEGNAPLTEAEMATNALKNVISAWDANSFKHLAVCIKDARTALEKIRYMHMRAAEITTPRPAVVTATISPLLRGEKAA